MTITLPATSLVAAGAALALAASLVLAAPSSAEPTGTSVAQGTIRSASGAPFATGTPVTLRASTPSTTLEVGDSVASAAVASTTVGAGGAFDLRVPSVADLAALASPDGLIDFEVRALDGTAYAPHSFTREVVGSGAAAELVEPGTVPDPAGSRSAAPPPATEPLAVTALPTPADPAVARLAVRPTTARVTQVCGETRVADLGSRQVRVGSTSAASGITGRFVYSNGASSSIGAGYSTSGKAGSWSQKGTTTTKSTESIDYGTRTGSHVYLTHFRFGKYSNWCYPINIGASGKKVIAYKVRADRYLSGSVILTGLAPATKNCGPHYSGVTHTKTTTSAHTWQTGASTAPVIGISLSSKTGYSSSAKVSVKNNRKTTTQICGTGGSFIGTPLRIVGK